jgi:hypothetical protein
VNRSWRTGLYRYTHPERWPLPVLLPVAATCGAIMGWASLEIFFEEGGTQAVFGFANTFMSPVSLGFAAGMLCSVDSLVRGRVDRALPMGVAGFGVTFVLCFLMLVPSQVIFDGFMPSVRNAVAVTDNGLSSSVIVGRSLSWGLLGLAVGTGIGISFRSGRIFLGGAMGGLLGGFAAGSLFDPLILLISRSSVDSAWVGRVAGFAVIAGMSAFFTSLAQLNVQNSSLLITTGTGAGKRFSVDSAPCFVGSSSDCEVVLSADERVTHAHAVIMRVGFAFVIEDLDGRVPFLLNGRCLARSELQDGDVVRIRGCDLLFSCSS